MSNIGSSILAFVVAIGVLVSVHEFGHFWVARRLGFKVLRFSIGFGRPLARWRGAAPDYTEYWLSSIPLGGYVKMLDERETPVADVDRDRGRRESERKRRPVAHLEVQRARRKSERWDVDGDDQLARLERRLAIGTVARKTVERTERNDALARGPDHAHARIQSHERDRHVRRMHGDALVARAEDGVHAVVPFERSAA